MTKAEKIMEKIATPTVSNFTKAVENRIGSIEKTKNTAKRIALEVKTNEQLDNIGNIGLRIQQQQGSNAPKSLETIRRATKTHQEISGVEKTYTKPGQTAPWHNEPTTGQLKELVRRVKAKDLSNEIQ